MNSFLVPLQSGAQTFTLPIGNLKYSLTLLWNHKASQWIMDISTANSLRVLSGIPLVFNSSLLRPFRYLNLGFTFVCVPTNPNVVASYDNLSTQMLFYLITS